MTPSFADVAQLQYQHVEVVTGLQRNDDFSSPFCTQAKSTYLTFQGYLKAIDPISRSAIICDIDSDNSIQQNLLILGHHILEIRTSDRQDALPRADVEQIVETDSQLKAKQHPFFSNQSDSTRISGEEVSKRREEITAWLSKLRIPNVHDNANNEIIVSDTVRIKPPYESTSDYVCPTRIVLNRVKRIVDSRQSNLLHLNSQDSN